MRLIYYSLGIATFAFFLVSTILFRADADQSSTGTIRPLDDSMIQPYIYHQSTNRRFGNTTIPPVNDSTIQSQGPIPPFDDKTIQRFYDSTTTICTSKVIILPSLIIACTFFIFIFNHTRIIIILL